MERLEEAAKEIGRGKVVAYPTESFWAVGADATNATAIYKVRALKKREKKPIAVIAGNWQQVEKFFIMTKLKRSIAHRHWPGALTMLLKPKKVIAADPLFGTTPARPSGRATPPRQRRGGIRIGVRIPQHVLARKLCLAAGVPLTATSANISGEQPTKSVSKVRQYFPDVVLIHGRCGREMQPSTVVEVDNGRIMILRQGAVALSPKKSVKQ